MPSSIGELRRIQYGLRGPDRIEFMGHHGAIDVEVVTLVDALFAFVVRECTLSITRAYALPGYAARVLLHAHFPEPLAHRAATRFLQLRAQGANGLLERAAVVVFLVCLAVALKTAPLIQMEQRPTEFFRGQRLFKSLGAKLIRIQCLQLFACTFVLGEETVLHQFRQHPLFALEQTISTTAHSASRTARDGERAAILGIAPITKNTHSGADQCGWTT